MVVACSILYARAVMREKRGSGLQASGSSAKKKRAAATKKAVEKKAVEKKAATKKKLAADSPEKKKAAAAPKKKAAAAAPKKKAAARKKVPAAAVTAREIPAPRPSERAMAVAAQLPKERALTDEEREAMSKVAHTALSTLDIDGVPELVVMRIGAYVDEVRLGARPEPASQDVRLGLGVLWGEQVRAQVGWRWVHLSYPNGFASYALVPDDRAFACFPLNRLAELMKSGADGVNTSVPLFDSIRVGTLPTRRENAYLVIG